MSLKMITKRLERLERKVNVVVAPENLPFDYDLLTPEEQDLSSVTHLLHDKAVELGYGKLEACQYRFVRNPWLDPEVFAECVAVFTDEERRRYERAIEIFEKCTRLTSCLTEEEKEAVKEYNHMVIFFKYGWKGRFMDCKAPDYTVEEFEEAKQRYSQIMAKYGEKTYECPGNC